MPIINVTLPSDDTTANVSDYNVPITTILSTVNGNLDSDNLADSAITTNKINNLAVTTAKIADDAVTNAKIADDAVTAPKLVGIDKSNLTTDSNPYKFSCKNSVDQTGVAQNTWTTLALGTELFDTNNNFASNIYTVPVSGFYFFSASTWCLATATGNMIGLAIRFVKNGSVELRRIYNYDNNVTYDVMSQDITGLFELAEGDTVSFMGNGVTVSGTVYFNNVYFNGFLVSKT